MANDPIDVDAIEVPNIYADPRLAPAFELLAAFNAKSHQLENARQVLVAENVIRNSSAGPASSTGIAQRAHLARLLSDEPSSVPVVPAAPDTPTKVLLDGLAILRDAPFTPLPDYAGQLAAADRGLAALRLAIAAQRDIVDAIIDELTFELYTKLQPKWNQLQLQFYRDAQQLARSTARIRELRNRLTTAGYRSRSDLLLTPNVRAPLMLGSETSFDSEISGWRRILEGWKIL